MGHYASEMGYGADDDEAERKREEQWRERRIEEIEEMLVKAGWDLGPGFAKRAIATVLADLRASRMTGELS